MREFIITSDQMKMLVESVGYFVDEPISEVVIGGETLPDAGELRDENAKLRWLVRDMWFWSYEGHMDSESQEWQTKHIGGVLDRMRELGIEVC